MKRRKALKHIGVGLSLGYALPQWLTSCDDSFSPNDRIPYDGHVVIVGAGASGLYLANILHSRGIRVTVLEASDQLGGRVRSFNLADNTQDENRLLTGLPAELGAEIIYGSDSILAVEMMRYGVDTVEVSPAFESRFVLGDEVKSAAEWAGDPDFQEVERFLSDLSGYSGPPSTVEQAASGFSGRASALLNARVGNLYGTSNESLGMRGLAAQLSARSYQNNLLALKQAMQPFFAARFYAQKYPIVFNAPVNEINYGGGVGSPISLTYGNNQQMSVNKVVVTVPVSMLKNNSISFSPALPAAKTTALNSLGMGPCIRVILEFTKNFWGESSNFIWGMDNAPHCFSSGIGRSDKGDKKIHRLSMTIHGPKASALSLMGNNMINPILAELDKLYAGDATAFVRKSLDSGQIISVIQDWGLDPYIGGGYSYPLVSASLDTYTNLSEAIQSKLFFAGEATDAKGYAGTLNGALNSAERVSKEVIDSIINA